MVKSRNIVEIDNQDECSIPLVQKFAVEEICHKFRRNLSRLLPEYEKSAAILGLAARSQFLHMRGAENWNLRKANLDTNLGVTRLPHPETTRIRSQEISGKCFWSGSIQKKEGGRALLFFRYFPLFYHYFQLGLFFTNYPPSGTSWRFSSESPKLKRVKRQTFIYHQFG